MFKTLTKTQFIFVVLLLVQLTTTQYFLNLDYFIKPMDSKIRKRASRDKIQNDAINQLNDELGYNKPNLQAYLQGKKKTSSNTQILVNNATQQRFKIKSERRQENFKIQTIDFKDSDQLYTAIGIPEAVIEKIVWPIHMKALIGLYQYFPKKKIAKKELQNRIQSLKQMLGQIQQKYLGNITAIVLGQNNTVYGSRIYSNTDNTKIVGINVTILDGTAQGVALKGKNIVRMGRFDIHLDEIDKIKTHPQDAIHYLEDQQQ